MRYPSFRNSTLYFALQSPARPLAALPKVRHSSAWSVTLLWFPIYSAPAASIEADQFPNLGLHRGLAGVQEIVFCVRAERRMDVHTRGPPSHRFPHTLHKGLLDRRPDVELCDAVGNSGRHGFGRKARAAMNH